MSDPKPVRVQLSRAKGWRMPPNTVKVDRSTRWGNPFSIQAAIDWGFTNTAKGAAFVVECFRTWIGGGHDADSMWMGPESEKARAPFADLAPLRGKNLACWCKPGAPCHADVLLELANAPETPRQQDELTSQVGRSAVQGAGDANGTPSPKPHEDRADG